MNLRSASIFYYQGKFYIPSSVESESGVIIDAEPVYETGVYLGEMEKVIENALLTPRLRVSVSVI